MAGNFAPGIIINEIDNSQSVQPKATNIVGMMGIAEKGPINTTVSITSWDQYVRIFGGYVTGGYLAYAVKGFFEDGGKQLFINRVAHYTDATDKATLTAVASSVTLKGRNGVAATVNTGSQGSNRITWTAKSQGTAGNSITVTLVASGANTPLTVSVTSSAITVNLATSAVAGTATSTVAQVLAAILASTDASALVTATSVETGTMAAVTQTSLTGGVAAGDSLKVSAINEGVWGDDISVDIADGTASPTTEFNVVVRFKNEIIKTYRDLSMDDTAANYVGSVITGSTYIAVEDLTTQPTATTLRPATGSFDLASGNDGLTSLSDADYIGDSSTRIGVYAFDAVQTLNLLCAPGVTTAPVINALNTYASGRLKMIAIADTPISLIPVDAMDFRLGRGDYTHSAFNTSYMVLAWPWLSITDPVTGAAKLVPPSGKVAACMARVVNPWDAPAGTQNGLLHNVNSLEYNASGAEIALLYSQGINVIISDESGIYIDGQKTLLQSTSKLNRVHARQLLNYMESAVEKSTKFVKFKANNSSTWNQLLRLLRPFFQGIMDNGGLDNFYVKCDEDINPPEQRQEGILKCRIGVYITDIAEWIQFDFEINTETNSTTITEIAS